jgi:hypothetical protein
MLRLFSGALVAALLLTTAVTIIQTNDATPATAQVPVTPQTTLRALNTPAQASDAMPPALAQFVAAMKGDADLAGARLASVRADRAVYLVPNRNRDSVCFPVHYQSGQSTLQCETLARIQAGGGRPTITGGPLGAVLMNVVPDEVHTATARSASGETVTTAVENNVYQLEVDPRKGPVTVSYDTAGGPIEWLVEFPSLPPELQ